MDFIHFEVTKLCKIYCYSHLRQTSLKLNSKFYFSLNILYMLNIKALNCQQQLYPLQLLFKYPNHLF